MGDRRPPSPLNHLQPDHWLARYTTDLIDLLNVLTLLVELEPEQEKLLDRICSGPLVSLDKLNEADALVLPEGPGRKTKKEDPKQGKLLDH